MAKRPCKPLGWVLRHTKTKLWYSGSSGANWKRTQNWVERPGLAKQYATANRAQSAGYMIERVIGDGVTAAYLLVESEGNYYAIRFSTDRTALVENDFDLNIRKPFETLDNPVNR